MVLSPTPGENLIMASLEQRGRKFRIVFRFKGEKYSRALNTKNESTAKACLARIEENLITIRERKNRIRKERPVACLCQIICGQP